MATFVFLHGAGGRASDWDLVSSYLEPLGHRVIAVDLPCAGDDPRPLLARALTRQPGPAGVVREPTVRSRTVPGRRTKGADAARAGDAPVVGVGPHPLPWPEDPRLDPVLLAEGDRRNVIDRYRYWKVDAIVADLDERGFPVEVAIENWEHDLNIGTVVRNANAFGVRTVHIVGRRRWNRRGAMVTDRYLHVEHHPDVESLLARARERQLAVIGVDNLDGAVPLESVELPERSLLVFGQEGPGLSDAVRGAAEMICSITMFGSTRSINAGVASGIALHRWVTTHAIRLSADTP